MITIDITLPVLIILGILSFVISLYFGNYYLNVYSFDIYVLNAFESALDKINIYDPYYNKLITEYDNNFNAFKHIYDKSNKRFYPFKKLTVTSIYGENVAKYLQPYIDKKYL